MDIRPLTKNDCISVAVLHRQFLPTQFTGQPGLQLLHLYYQTIARGSGAIGFVAEHSGEVVGFVCGVWDQRSLYRKLMIDHSYRLVFWAIVQVLIKPNLFLSLLRRFKRNDTDKGIEGYELRPIVTSLSARGTGLSAKLVDRLSEDADQRGFANIHLITEQDNVAARKFYTKVGFQEVEKINRFGIYYVTFARSLGNKL